MSTRTSPAVPARKRPAGGAPKRRLSLRDARIRAKLSVILVIPILAILSLATARLVDSGHRALSAQLVSSLTGLSTDIADATHELQKERMDAAAEVKIATSGADDAAKKAAATAFSTQAKVTDAAIGTYATHRGHLDKPPGGVNDRLTSIDQQLPTLDSIRHQVTDHQGISVGEVVVRYGVIIDDLVAYHSQVAQQTTDQNLATSLRAVASFAQAKAQTSKEQAIGYAALSGGTLDTQQYGTFIATLTGQESALTDFGLNATPTQAALVNTTITGDAVQLADQVAQQVGRSVGRATPLISADDLARALGAVVDLMRWAEQKLDAQLVTDAKALQNAVVRAVVIESSLVIITIALAIAVAFILARALSRSLSRLRESALNVVGRDLPNAVARLRDIRELGETTPEEIAEQLVDPVKIDSRDEIGQVAQAFNAVHREAVRVAAEQAGLRTSVSAMFLNLARRSQALVDRMIGELDTIERTEEDPKRLAQLFQLDHLATRMRRNDENLLVLAGADSSSPRRDNALLADVLRAAQSEIELYNRLEFGTVDMDVSVVSHAVNDVVRLVAELFDNATRFSPPESTVVADGRRIGDYVLVQIEDRGLGMSPEQMRALNDRLAEPPNVDVTAFRMMGLAVVSRLANRYRIKVEMRTNPDGGTITNITLPTAILVLPRLRGREPVIARPRAPLAVEQAVPAAPATWPMPQLPGLAANGHGSPAGVMTANRSTFEVPIAPRPAVDARPTIDARSTVEARPADVRPADVHPVDARPTRDPAAPPRPTYDPAAPARPSHDPAAPARPSHDPAAPARPTHDPAAPPRPTVDALGYPTSAQRTVVADDTTELPIFRAMEAVWFRSHDEPATSTWSASTGPGRSTTQNSTAASAMAGPMGQSSTNQGPMGQAPRGSFGQPPMGSGGSMGSGGLMGSGPIPSTPTPPPYVPPAAVPPPVPPSSGLPPRVPSAPPASGLPPRQAPRGEESWRTAADDGWRAAAAASEPSAAGTTRSGLPKRVPAAQLVPGAVDARTSNARARRTPDEVRGLLSAYHRGVQRGRSGAEGSSLGGRPDPEETH